MSARKRKGRSRKATSRSSAPTQKSALGGRSVARSKKMAAKELVLGPLQKPGQSIVDAARRLWLSAETMIAQGVRSTGRLRRKRRAKTPR
jgi:hypothetical protein